jgi:hypothetical protein
MLSPCNLLWFGLFGFGYVNAQNPVDITSLDFVDLNITWQCNSTAKFTLIALTPVISYIFTLECYFPFTGNG